MATLFDVDERPTIDERLEAHQRVASGSSCLFCREVDPLCLCQMDEAVRNQLRHQYKRAARDLFRKAERRCPQLEADKLADVKTAWMAFDFVISCLHWGVPPKEVAEKFARFNQNTTNPFAAWDRTVWDALRRLRRAQALKRQQQSAVVPRQATRGTRLWDRDYFPPAELKPCGGRRCDNWWQQRCVEGVCPPGCRGEHAARGEEKSCRTCWEAGHFTI